MKTFFKKYGTIAIAVVIANLFLVNNVFGQTIGTPTVSPTSGCTGSTITATFLVTNGSSGFRFTTSTNYTIQLSSSSGSFTFPTNLLTFQSSTAPINSTGATATITSPSATIPVGTSGGAGYRIRIISSSPTVQGSQSGTLTINVAPNAFNVTGGGSFCAGGTGVAVGLQNSETGVTYQLFKGASSVGSSVSGNGSSITFGNQTDAGTYTVVATKTSGGCTNDMTGSAIVSINSLPTAHVDGFNNLTCYFDGTGTPNGSSITISATGGSGSGYSFSIDNGSPSGHYYNSTGSIYIPGATFNASTKTFAGLPAGSYKVRVKDGNQCESKSVQ